MKSFLRRLWTSWTRLTARFGDFQARWILTVFYFTLALPFGLLGRFALDLLHTRRTPIESAWIKRQTPHDNNITSAQREF